MSAFLLLLVKVNLAMAAAVGLVFLLRRPLRASFGAPIAYGLWLLVPVTGLASLLPPRVVTLAPVAAVRAAPMVHSSLHAARLLTGQSIVMLPVPAPGHVAPDITLLLFAAWALGSLAMALHLGRLQFRFHAAARAGQAGPAVLGFLTPRIVMPDGFADIFTAPEQAAILAHESVHLARQDARINALAALLRCLNWFNPLIHLGAHWLRVDQELACDATAVARHVSRRDYAQALLKSQLAVMSLPLGCNWPGAQHPLIERVAQLKRQPPGRLRRLTGAGLVLLSAGFAGLGTWAAQPPVARFAASPTPIMVSALTPPLAQDRRAAQPVSTPVSENNTAGAPKDVRAARVALLEKPRTVRIDAGVQSLLAALPQAIAVSEPALPAHEPEPVVMADTPSGEGDPDTIVCRAPQRIPGTDQFGDVACGHNYEWKKLAWNGKDLAADDKTLIPRATVDRPTGKGDPNGVTCRTPFLLSANPPVCRTNRFWASLIANGQTIDEHGQIHGQQAAAMHLAVSDNGDVWNFRTGEPVIQRENQP